MRAVFGFGFVAMMIALRCIAADGTAAINSQASIARTTGLDAAVQRLTQMLDLDVSQQAAVTKALVERRDRVKSVWSNSAMPAAQRIAATKSIDDQTVIRIRALLTDEQRALYRAEPQSRDRDINTVSVESWMSKAQAGEGAR